IKGNFRLFVKNEEQVDSKHLMYNLTLLATNGKKYQFMGFKLLTNTTVHNAYAETTTIYATIYEYKNGDETSNAGVDINRKIIGRGILRISFSDFFKQIRTFK
ncbi:23363_t:CDS:1, partial [Racocetra persica]